MLTRRKVLLYKVETTKGTDAVPTVANDLIIPIGEVNIAVPTEQDAGEGELKGTMGPGAPITIKQAMSLELSSRVRGLGQGAAALLTPDIHAALIASGHTVTTGGAPPTTPRTAEYKPTSVQTSLGSASGYFFEDGLLYKLLGSVNTLSFEASMNALLAKFTPQAPYAVPTVVALPAFDYPAEKLFIMTNALAAITEGGGAVNIGAFTFDAGVDVQENFATGEHFFEVANRVPIITIDPKAVANANDWNALTNATAVALVATFTNSLGETLVFSAPNGVPREIAPGDRAGRITRAKTFALKESAAGDDQYTIKWTAIL